MTEHKNEPEERVDNRCHHYLSTKKSVMKQEKNQRDWNLKKAAAAWIIVDETQSVTSN